MFDLNTLLRKNIKDLQPYATARDDFKGKAEVFLDANENPFPSPYNRYPDPHQSELKQVISTLKEVQSGQIILGNGSDEIIDLLIRTFCEPGIDNIIAPKPTYGMYRVWAQINNIVIKEPTLTTDFDIDIDKIKKEIDTHSKLIFLCSPNNPSGNLMDGNKIQSLLDYFSGIVVIDEAYIDFTETRSLLYQLNKYPNLVILQTLSKAWGLAGIRLGIGFGSTPIIEILSKIKAPYNISTATQQIALELLSKDSNNSSIKIVVIEREKLEASLAQFSFVEKVFPSQANFLLARFTNAKTCYNYLLGHQIIVRDRSSLVHCDNCLRITVGTNEENLKLIQALKEYEASTIH